MTARLAALLACLLLWPPVARSQSAEPSNASTDSPARASSSEHSTAAIAQFLAGAAIGLGLHEGAHVATAWIFDADPGVKKVTFGPLPFFAIFHEDVSPAREYVISSSGFWMQHASSEWLLSRRPRLRGEHAPLAKGLLAFNVLTSFAYSTAAFGTFGPYERDTRSMADSLDVAEPWVGAMILAPAALDTWRYFRPESRWAAWTSRAVKAGAVLMMIRAAQ